MQKCIYTFPLQGKEILNSYQTYQSDGWTTKKGRRIQKNVAKTQVVEKNLFKKKI